MESSDREVGQSGYAEACSSMGLSHVIGPLGS